MDRQPYTAPLIAGPFPLPTTSRWAQSGTFDQALYERKLAQADRIYRRIRRQLARGKPRAMTRYLARQRQLPRDSA